MENLDFLDRQLLNELQRGLLCVEQPFAELGARVGLSAGDVLDRINRFQKLGFIRQISAIFDSKRLGYRSMLVGLAVQPSNLNEVAGLISSHPGVSHNYEREHRYNLWFTLTVSPESRLGLEKTGLLLAEDDRVVSALFLPALRRFKIGMRLNLVGSDQNWNQPHSPEVSMQSNTARTLTESEKLAVRLLQQNLPLDEHPFRTLAANSTLSEQALINLGRQLQQIGRLRRLAAILHHRKAGYSANGMGVWVVPPERIEATGEQMASHDRVTHCYQRPTFPDWKFSLFTMVHGQSRDDCEAVMQQLSQSTGIRDYEVLYSTTEFKKSRIKYFTKDEAEWESKNQHLAKR